MLAEPRVLDRRVRWHQVHQHGQSAGVRLEDERIHIRQGPEDRVDPGVVRHVISEVGKRRRVDRRHPQRVDPEPDQVIEPVDDPAEIAYPVTVRILERARVDLVDDSVRAHSHISTGLSRPQSKTLAYL
jgi:hypothetical protein